MIFASNTKMQYLFLFNNQKNNLSHFLKILQYIQESSLSFSKYMGGERNINKHPDVSKRYFVV